MQFCRYYVNAFLIFYVAFSVGCNGDAGGTLTEPMKPPKPEIELSFSPTVSRTPDGQVLVKAKETTGAGEQVFRATNLVIDSVLDKGGQPVRFRLVDYQIRFEQQDAPAPKNLVLEMTIASTLKDVLGLVEGIVEFRVGKVQEVVLPLSEGGSSLSSDPILGSVGITGSTRLVSNVGLKLDGENTGQIKEVRISNGSELMSPNILTQSDSEYSFGWQKVDKVTPNSEILIWMKGSKLDAAADWSIKLDPTTTSIQHPTLDISGTFQIQSIWDVKLSGTKNNLVSAAIFDSSGQPASGRPKYSGVGEASTISMSAIGSSLNLHIRFSADGAINRQPFRFADVPIQN